MFADLRTIAIATRIFYYGHSCDGVQIVSPRMMLPISNLTSATFLLVEDMGVSRENHRVFLRAKQMVTNTRNTTIVKSDNNTMTAMFADLRTIAIATSIFYYGHSRDA